MKAWRRKMNAALGAARAAAAAGNMAAAANYHQAAMNRAVNRGTSQTISNVAAQAPPTPGGINASPAIVPKPAPPYIPPPAAPAHTPQTTYRPSAPAPAPVRKPPPPPPPKPPAWLKKKTFQPVEGVRQADPDTVLFDESTISPELLIQLQYEDVGGVELANVSRSDIIDGQNIIYSPIKNLSDVRRRYNPNNIIPLSENSNSFLNRFSIEINLRQPYVPYFNDDGDLVIEVEDIKDDEVIEVQVDRNGIINEVEL